MNSVKIAILSSSWCCSSKKLFIGITWNQDFSISIPSVCKLFRIAITAPGGIAIHDNALYVADTISYRVLDRETGLVQQTLRSFATPVELPQTVSVNDQNVIIGSWISGVVQRLNRETGDVLNTYTDLGVPYDAVELSDGSILVADCANGRIIQILDSAGINRRTIS